MVDPASLEACDERNAAESKTASCGTLDWAARNAFRRGAHPLAEPNHPLPEPRANFACHVPSSTPAAPTSTTVGLPGTSRCCRKKQDIRAFLAAKGMIPPADATTRPIPAPARPARPAAPLLPPAVGRLPRRRNRANSRDPGEDSRQDPYILGEGLRQGRPQRRGQQIGHDGLAVGTPHPAERLADDLEAAGIDAA